MCEIDLFFSIKYGITPASISPLLVPITKPSSGVRPIEVLIDFPSLTAQTDDPFPR